MQRLLVLTLAWAITGSMALADSPSTEPAARAWAITDAVLTHHVEPPSRQEMLLAGIRAVARAGHDDTPPDLARRVSEVTTSDQLASLLSEISANSKLIDKDKREEVFFDGLLGVVPGGADLMSAKERKVTESMEANLYVGIQVALGLDDKAKKPVFIKILEGGPAEHAGTKAGDLIESVDGVPTEGMPLAKVVDRLRGEEGTEVIVCFRRPSTHEEFTRPMTRGRLPRATIQGLSPLPEKRWSVRFDGASPIGYLKITEISGSTPRELRTFAEQLETEGVKALVLDLRAVEGATFHPTLLLADALLDGGIIGRVRTANGEKVYRAEPDALFRDWPMAVLVGGRSTPEVAWLAEALRENRKAKVIGNLTIASTPDIKETISLPGGEWSIKMVTGRLDRADGQPIAMATLKNTSREPVRMLEVETRLSEAFSKVFSEPDLKKRGEEMERLTREIQATLGERASGPDPLVKARANLEEALKPTAK